MGFATDKEIGQRIARLREDAGRAQPWLAQALNIDQHALGEIERGERPLGGRELAVLARCLGTSHSELVVDDGAPVLLSLPQGGLARARSALDMFHKLVDFHFGVEALVR